MPEKISAAFACGVGQHTDNAALCRRLVAALTSPSCASHPCLPRRSWSS